MNRSEHTLALPDLFLNRMQQLTGQDFTKQYDFPQHRGVRLNPLKGNTEQIKKELCDILLDPVPFSSEGYEIEENVKLGNHPLHHAGALYVQEPSAMSVVNLLQIRSGETVLDLCAAPGGKSTQIAAALKGDGLLWCNEYVRSRASVLLQNLERLGVSNSVVTSLDSEVIASKLPDYFDAVLVDAPCSGEGMFRKEPVALEQWSIDNIILCQERAATILENASKTVKPGGRLMLSTCTFAPEENECQVLHFLNTHPEFELVDIPKAFGRNGFSYEKVKSFTGESNPYSVDLTKCLRIFPEDGGEGHFMALMKRKPIDFSPSVSANNTSLPPKELAEALETWIGFVPNGNYTCVNTTWHFTPASYQAQKGLPVLSAGVPVAEVCKNRLEPTHYLFSAFGGDAPQKMDFSAMDSNILAFLHGETISCPFSSGYVAVCVCGACVGFGKATNGVLKNHYPKGLRTLKIE